MGATTPPANLREIRTKVRGVTQPGRQTRVAGLRPNQQLQLAREPTNPVDTNAIKVLAGANQLGYLGEEVAVQLAPWMDRGHRWNAFVLDVTGGTSDAPTRGVNIVLREAPPPPPPDPRPWWRRLFGGT